MTNRKKFIVSHAPFWHYGSNINERSYHTIFAALPAVLLGVFQYGLPALAVVALSISTSILWEWAFSAVTKRPNTVGDGNAALIGLLLAMGLYQWEVERIWLFLVPLAAIPAARQLESLSWMQGGRLVAILAGEENIREVMLFQMNQRAEDLMMGAPSDPTNEQLRELRLRVLPPEN